MLTKVQVKPTRFDPYKNMRFRLKFAGRTVLGVSKASPLKRTTDAVVQGGGGKSVLDRKLPGLRKFENVTLERGIIADPEFFAWATAKGGDTTLGPGSARRDLVLEMLDEQGGVAQSYRLHGCRVSELQSVPDLDANANAVMVATMKLEMEGWEQDTTIVGPKEPL